MIVPGDLLYLSFLLIVEPNQSAVLWNIITEELANYLLYIQYS